MPDEEILARDASRRSTAGRLHAAMTELRAAVTAVWAAGGRVDLVCESQSFDLDISRFAVETADRTTPDLRERVSYTEEM